MQRLLIAATVFLLFTCPWNLAWGAGNSVEQFDTAGLPATPQSFLEQQIREAIATHRPGDYNQDVFIQSKLAEYYREHGDATRAHEAEARAALAQSLAGQATQNQAAAPASGEISAPSFGEVAAPSFGEVAAPQTRKMVSEPQTLQTTSAPNTKPSGSAVANASTAGNCDPFGTAASASSSPRTTGWQGLYYRMEHAQLIKWSFLKDGCFVHEGITDGVGAAVRGEERGSFLIGHGWIELHIQRSITGYLAAGSGYGASNATETRTLKLPFRLLGKQGDKGMLLNHQHYAVRDWY